MIDRQSIYICGPIYIYIYIIEKFVIKKKKKKKRKQKYHRKIYVIRNGLSKSL